MKQMEICFLRLRLSLIRSKLMLMGNEPALALEDLKEVMSEEPDSIPGWIIKVDYK